MKPLEGHYTKYSSSFSDLLKSYVDQRDKMATLQSQVDTLEEELDSLNKDFDEKLGEYNSCKNEG